jgi:adenylate cyclase
VPPERIERKLAAILAADVAGYSRLMGADEEGTLARLKACRGELLDPKIAEHRGRVVKTTGDGILIEFPSVVDAVRCAMDVQRDMAGRNADVTDEQRIEFRVGINLGDIMIDAEDIHGDGVNIAARLEGIAEPGGICISDSSYQQVRDKLSIDFEDMGQQQLKNIARPVRVYRIPIGRSAPRERPSLALPDKPSIAILPFDNMSEVSEDIYFADGIAEDIITELSRYPDLFIVARNSSFTYRGKAVRVGDVARELGVRYVLEGSVRRAGNRVRINAQLIDATNGNHLWAQRYDRNLEDLFSVQDEVTQSIVAVLPERVQSAAFETASRKTRSSLDAYDHLLRGKYCHHLETAEANSEAESHFDRAINLDPRFASAYAWKACTLGQAWNDEFRPRTPELFQGMIQLVERAASLDENDTECHRIMCRIALIQAKYAKSEYHLERALALNPNDPRLVVQRGINLTFIGDPEGAIPWIEKAMRLDPFSAYRYYLDHVRALFMARRPAEAVAVLERTTREQWEHYVWAAASNAAQNEQPAAREAAQRAIAMRPQLSIASYVDGRFKWKRSEDRARLRDALAQAGLPE